LAQRWPFLGNKIMKMKFVALAVLAASVSAPAMASTCIGNCGTLGANGDVSAPPAAAGSSTYTYVSTAGGVAGGGQIAGAGGTNGSEYLTSAFSAASGDSLNFYFDYVTSDGSGFADYGFAELLTSSLTHVAWLFTARTTPSGDTSPGFGLPANDSTLIPATTPIQGGTTWAPLGGYSGNCFSGGCGNTGWIESQYAIADTGNYVLRLGTTNYSDSIYDSGLAFAGVTVGGVTVPTGGVPEPASWMLMLGGFGAVGGAMRSRRKAAVSFG
jgi:hypothetical protein